MALLLETEPRWARMLTCVRLEAITGKCTTNCLGVWVALELAMRKYKFFNVPRVSLFTSTHLLHFQK
jgi:hypothetical protein